MYGSRRGVHTHRVQCADATGDKRIGINLSPITNGQGQIEGAICLLSDLTEIVELQSRVKLKGGDNEWRIRIGDYRVVYVIDDAKSSVEVTRVRHRGEIYQS